MATQNRKERLEPSYKQHTAVDDKSGVIVDVELTTGEEHEGSKLLGMLERVESVTKRKVERVTADKGYAQPRNYAGCEERGTQALIPPARPGGPRKRMMVRRFKYDGRHKIVHCPQRKILRRYYRVRNGWIYRGRSSDCLPCMHRRDCLSPGYKTRTVLIVNDYEALLRARRGWLDRDDETRRLYARHRWWNEGKHGEAKTQHGLRRAARRGQWNVAIQSYMTAAVMNLKRLAASLWLFLRRWWRVDHKLGVVVTPDSNSDRFPGHQPEIGSRFDAAA